MNGKAISARQITSDRISRVMLLGLICLLAAGSLAVAADSRETMDFIAASKVFRDRNYATAEKWFGDFIREYANSPRRFEAVLGLAESRYFLKASPDETVQLLSTNLTRSGKLGSEYLYWIGEIYFQGSNYLAAATNYARVRVEFPNSTNLLAASYSEAFSYSLLGQSSKVVEVLGDSNGAFQTAARTNAGNPLVARGALLLAGIFLDQRRFPEGEAALARLAGQTFERDLDWRRQELICRLLMGEERLPEALAATDTLMDLARKSGRPELLAQSFVLKAGIYERQNEFDLAERTYTNNFDATIPSEFRRGALLKVIELDRRQERATDSVRNLETFAALYPQDPILDVIQFTLGEVRLKEYHREMSPPPDLAPPATNALPSQATNLLVQAITNFSRVIDGFKQSPLVGKSLLDRGWCWWGLTNFGQADKDFGNAAQVLPAGEDQDLARFKQAESEVQMADFTNAVQNFRRLIVQHTPEPGSITNSLLEPAVTEMLNAAINSGDQHASEEAFTNLSRWFPDSTALPRATLSYGGSLIKGRPADARDEFTKLLAKFPQFPLGPEVRWAVSRTYKREGNWKAATRELNQWVANYPSNAALPQVEFERAILYSKAGMESNALNLFTNFVARFATNTNAPAAQFWVGDHYFNEGEYALAEGSFETLFQNTNWPTSDLKFLARLSAGQSALARQSFKAAMDYLKGLIDDPQCPPSIRGMRSLNLETYQCEAPEPSPFVMVMATQ